MLTVEFVQPVTSFTFFLRINERYIIPIDKYDLWQFDYCIIYLFNPIMHNFVCLDLDNLDLRRDINKQFPLYTGGYHIILVFPLLSHKLEIFIVCKTYIGSFYCELNSCSSPITS